MAHNNFRYLCMFQVMGGLVPKLQPGIIPHYAVLHTVANLACANVCGFIPFLKATVDTILPLLPSIKSDSIRQIFAYGEYIKH